jgi:hypothetical protein
LALTSLAALAPAGAARIRQRAPFRGPHRITIHAQPNPIVAGEPVVIFGRLLGRDQPTAWSCCTTARRQPARLRAGADDATDVDRGL